MLGPAAPQFLFGPLVDRWPLRRVLVGTQASQMLLVLVPVAWALAAVTAPTLVMSGGSVGFAFVAAFVLVVLELRGVPRVADAETLAVE